MSDDTSDTTVNRIAAWAFFVLLGPLNFGGEIAGPTGAVAWRQIAAGLLGTGLWIAVAMVVINHV